ncbi:hypothetical protein U9M48_031465 [Paspalum notatum var. saurae]|uniref:Uncharacterized protein n=1 Tax=Paspalum notatum var. saurae TaxID=547442 RepID=A0AAQ3X3S2_PASNO
MHLHSYALMPAPFMHIDPAIEEETVQEQPLIEEPAEEQENQQPTTDPAAEETNPSEEEDQLDIIKLGHKVLRNNFDRAEIWV